MTSFKFISIICGFVLIGANGQLPSFITPCSRSLPTDQLTECVTNQARTVQTQFVKGIPEMGVETLDPLSITEEINAVAGTFKIKSTNSIVKGIRKAHIRDIKWDLKNNVGHTKLFGNFTFISDYETDGRVLIFPITGTGKLTVKMYDTEMVFKYKLKKVKDSAGVEHHQTYDSKSSEKFGYVKLHMSNIFGGAAIGDTVNQVLNDNWKELMSELGGTYTSAIAKQVHKIVNGFYYKIPADEMFSP